MTLISKQLTGQEPKGGQTAHGVTDAGITRPLLVADDGTLQTAVSGAGSGGTSSTDEATYTPGSSAGTAIMIARDDTATDTLPEGKIGIARGTEYRAVHVNLRDASGNEVAVGGGTQYTEGDVDTTITGNALLVEGAGNTLVPVQGTVADGILVNLGANNDVTASQSGTWNITNISGTVSLPTGASTSAKQDTGNTSLASIDTKLPANLTVSSTRLLTDSSGVTQPISASSLPLPTGASTLGEQQTQTTALQLIDDVVATTGSAVPSKANLIAGTDGTNARAFKTDSNGELQVDVLTLPSITATDLDIRDLDKATDDILIYTNTAKDGTGTSYNPIVDADGHLQVDVLSGGGGGTQYTEGDTDASITGTAMLMEGATNTLLPVQGTIADGLLVNLGANNDVTVSGVSTEVKQDTIIGHLDGVEGLLTTIDGDTGNISTKIDTIAGAVSGTEMQVDVVSMPTTTVQDGGGSLTVDAPVGTPVFVRLSDGASAIATLPVSLASVPSHDVTNAGTFAVQVDGSALTALQLIDDTIYADDSAFMPGTSKVNVVGYMADETSTDSVDEGDVGAARMTLDRKVVVSQYAHTAGGTTPYVLISASSTNATSLKASAGQIYSIQVFNTNASARYLKLYNKASAPTVGTDTPVKTILIPGASAGAGAAISVNVGISFSTGIAFALTTGIAHSDTGAVGANDIAVNIDYI